MWSLRRIPVKASLERGAGSVLAIGIIAGLATASTAAVAIIDLLTTASRVQRSADLAALATSDVSMGVVPGQPCDVARAAVRHSGFHLAHCLVSEGVAEVVVRFDGGWLPIEKRALAGPQNSPLWGDR